MLDADTKRQIDTLRDILVGKIPNPQSQVEQITTGLIYKFMDDMDQESVELGGEKSFFTGDYEKYAWKNLFDPKVGGSEKVKLYSEAVESMYLNPTAPQLFREIFKNAFLPFKDSSTLNMFLKEIDEFHYSHSEKLGDAFEYLLSFMGSQGDAGQFRTPRHIIDFIVEIVNPQKHESILDPACGSAGFLISSYKHILNTNTDKKIGDKLSAEDRKKIGDNLSGYDISPEMIRLSLVNMYLNGFQTPKIEEYDTLSNEDKWNEYYDVILANPPFFSPKGGIQPHKRFGVSSKKAEVLFTSYILDHLKPDGRAGIIVPEGIIFQTGTAYKELRKQLIENGLVGVISLPAGVFNPYSGVKTSILILDKKLHKQSDSIFFAEVKNDGFDLGAQRNQIRENDLPDVIKTFQEFSLSNNKENSIEKKEIIASSDIGLSKSRYLKIVRDEKINFKKIGDILNVFNGSTPSKKDESYWEGGDIPWFTIEDMRDQGYRIKATKQKITSKALEKTSVKLLPKHSVLLCCTASVGECAFSEIELTTNQQFNGLVVKEECKNHIDPKYIYWCSLNLKNELIRNSGSTSFNYLSVTKLKEIEIPLPSLEVQQEIVDELEGYQKIIDGCKQVVENYEPTIDIDPSWEMVELGELGEIISGGTPKSNEQSYWNGEIKWLTLVDLPADESISYITDSKRKITELGLLKSSAKMIPVRSVIVSSRATIGRIGINEVEVSTNQGFKSIVIDETKHLAEYVAVNVFLKRKYMQEIATGGTFGEINKTNFMKIKIPMPSLDMQKEIVQRIEEERIVIEGNKKLIEIYTQKIQDRINKVWGED